MKKNLLLIVACGILTLLSFNSHAQDDPIAGITPEYDSICPGLEVTFFDASYDPNGHTITSWEWNFGDGTTSNEMHGVHIYTTEGYHTVSLTVQNDVGGSNTMNIDYLVYNSVLIVSSQDVSCFGSSDGQATALNQLGMPFANTSWGVFGNEAQVSNLSAGIYSVSVSDENGCSDIASVQINQPTPLVIETISSECADSNNLGWISPNVTGGTLPYYYIWANGDTSPILTNIYANQTYCLTVVDMNGCNELECVTLSDDPCNMNLTGKVFIDDNTNCDLDTDEATSSILVRATPGPYYSYTNQNGEYNFYLNEGDYTIDVITPDYYSVSCPENGFQTVSITDMFDTITNVDLGLSADFLCALLDVNISSAAIRPCFESYIYISYSNSGTITEDNIYIEVELDPVQTYVSSSIPYEFVDGNIYTFNVGQLAPMDYGNFYMRVLNECDVNLTGTTACMSSIIYPHDPCEVDFGDWDHSSISVEGECVDNLEACFTITNTGDFGDGDMMNAHEYRIFANDTLIYIGTVQLVGGESEEICWETDGRAIRLEADQHPEHPGNSHPQETIEGCGDLTGTSLGFITNSSYDDNNEFIDTYCRIITNSYDPNEKLVHPSGITENHYIDNDLTLTYQINFQNTGTDTAFTVMITDTLTHVHDMNTFQNGASSHPCELEITGQGILKWTFNNILLPDSTTNEPESHGFVTYTVKPVEMTEEDYGTQLQNTAAIFFDFNPPVITNTTNLTFWDLPIMLLVKAPLISKEGEIKIYPNPAFDYITIQSEKEFSIITIMDARGSTIIEESKNQQTQEIDISNIKPGLYFIKLINKEGEEQTYRFVKN